MRFGLILIAAGLFMAAATTALADLCPVCQQVPVTKDIGRCVECSGMTMSGSYKLCDKCSDKLGQCERCRKDMTETTPATKPAFNFTDDGSVKAGRWEFRWTISNKGTRSAGVYSSLLFDGAAVPDPKNVNDYYETPFGSIYFVGRPAVQFGTHGWMPTPVGREPSGTKLTHPVAIEKTTVSVEVIGEGTYIGQESAVADKWIQSEMAKLGVTQFHVRRSWFALTSEPTPVHDTKLYGRALLSFEPSKGAGPLVITISGSKKAAIELPRQSGATRLVKHTLEDHLGNTLDLYLAMRVEIDLGAKGAATQPTKDPWSILD